MAISALLSLVTPYPGRFDTDVYVDLGEDPPQQVRPGCRR